MRRPLRSLPSLLIILALISQLVTPTLHASNWAKHNGDGLLYAFCGTISPALLAKMRDIAPPGLVAADDTHPGQLELCLSLGSLASAFVLAIALVLYLLRVSSHAVPPRDIPRSMRTWAAYQSRAPPPCTA
ncbi:hypothetical protein ATO7_11428 [Oceanococcus atlanticus]|uniref:Uncharacterized protein n=1 Tax=Oceanococcus atlanticus TaxID=1317117 RepID=A0A1Y1SBA1_9GAMM|nr:hypothetical protein [Oceanococcus atlanticus]ORE85901.1 hypothetical protein ATO7_11428 [Oceanococcus atlanticus]